MVGLEHWDVSCCCGLECEAGPCTFSSPKGWGYADLCVEGQDFAPWLPFMCWVEGEGPDLQGTGGVLNEGREPWWCRGWFTTVLIRLKSFKFCEEHVLLGLGVRQLWSRLLVCVDACVVEY